jgi:hypothetical protein
MAHRHKVHHHAKGGRVAYTGAGSNVEHEAEEEGAKRGGHMHHKGGGKVHGHKHKRRYARGGGVGADKHPFSSAHRGFVSARR